jgi:hypothetical protein
MKPINNNSPVFYLPEILFMPEFGKGSLELFVAYFFERLYFFYATTCSSVFKKQLCLPGNFIPGF